MVGLTSAEGASLAACQKDAIAPAREGIAVHIVREVARLLTDLASTKTGVHGNLSPDVVLIGYDGTVSLADIPMAATVVAASRHANAYLAPEQLSGGAVDRRADVFALGVMLWELLTGTNLFVRSTASETRAAILDDPILDVRDVNPDVPSALADVLATALVRDRHARFDTPGAFANALAGAAESCGMVITTKQELGAWVAERVPRERSAPRPDVVRAARAPAPATPAKPAPADVPDLDVPGASRAHRSLPKMGVAKAPSSPELGHAGIPALDVNAMAAEAVPPSSRSAAISPPPSSGRGSSAALPSGPRGSAPSVPGTGRSVAFDRGDADDFDMEIERNVASTSLPHAQSSRTAGGPASTRHGGAGTSLELAGPSRMARERAEREQDDGGEPAIGKKLAALALSTAIGGGTAFVLWKYMHHAGGFDVMKSMPHAFDGTSATDSGAISLVSLVVAVVVGFVGLRFKPHAWTVIAAGGMVLLLALAMVTVTLASTGENPTPPDGALLVPYLFPAAVLMFAIGLEGRAARLFAAARGARRVSGIPIAAIAGAIAFFAFEASRFAR